MGNTDLISSIVENYSRLTKTERKVADFVLKNPQKVLTATISDLAEMCDVCDTSVFRFCRSMNLNGYQEFKVSLALSTNGTSDSTTAPVKVTGDSLEEVCSNVLEAYQTALLDTANSINYKQVRKAVKLLMNAQSIHFFGVGISGATALYAQNKFSRITSKVHFTADSHLQIGIATLLPKEDIAIIFSNSGVTKDCINMARLAKENGASVIFITKFAKSPAAKYSDVLLLSGAVEGPLQGGSIAGKLSQSFMVDVLYAEFFRQMGDTAVRNKQRSASTIAEKML